MASIVLIGPTMVGKSTLAALLSQQLDLPIRSTHNFTLQDYAEQGFVENKEAEIWNFQGPLSYRQYMGPIHIKMVQKLLAQPGDAIIELGSDFAVYEDPILLEQFKEALKPFPDVLLLLPSPDLEESLVLLRNREIAATENTDELNDFFLYHPSNRELAKKIVYTKGKTPQQTCAEILAQLGPIQQTPIFLIGPIGTGKSTVGGLLAQNLGLKRSSLDVVRWKYYAEIGYNPQEALRLKTEKGLFGLYLYWQPFMAYAIKRLLEDLPDGVIDFGAGHSVYTDPDLANQVKELIAPYQNIFLLLPSPDLAQSKAILETRRQTFVNSLYDLHASFLRDKAFYELATQTFYTRGKSPENLAVEVANFFRNLSGKR